MKPANQRRDGDEQLRVALHAQRPIPTDRRELEIELLLPPHKRRITVADHERWLATGSPPHEGDADLAEGGGRNP